MLVRELIELLKGADPEMEVRFAYTAGDYWRTKVAAKIDEVDEGFVVHSDYHRMDKLVEPDADKEDMGYSDKLKPVVVLS